MSDTKAAASSVKFEVDQRPPPWRFENSNELSLCRPLLCGGRANLYNAWSAGTNMIKLNKPAFHKAKNEASSPNVEISSLMNAYLVNRRQNL